MYTNVQVRRPEVDFECPGQMFCGVLLSDMGSLIEVTVEFIVSLLQ